jgi:hypothetical protein
MKGLSCYGTLLAFSRLLLPRSGSVARTLEPVEAAMTATPGIAADPFVEQPHDHMGSILDLLARLPKGSDVYAWLVNGAELRGQFVSVYREGFALDVRGRTYCVLLANVLSVEIARRAAGAS